VRVVREPGAIGDGEMVEHEEGGEVAEIAGSDCATDAGADAFGLFDCFDDFGYCAGCELRGHGLLCWLCVLVVL